MSVFELKLTKFLFPKELSNNRANFRFVVDLRLINDKGQFATEHAVMPSLDTFWECDTSRDKKPNYVRGNDENNYGQFNMAAIDEWDRLILRVKGKRVHSIQFKVIDVNRKDAWDKVKNFLGGIVEAVIGKIKGVIPTESLPASLLSESFGSSADDVQSFLLKKLAGGEDILFRGSATLKAPDENAETEFTVPEPNNGGPNPWARGTEGDYKITFDLTQTT
jgi:hypothetical protein